MVKNSPKKKPDKKKPAGKKPKLEPKLRGVGKFQVEVSLNLPLIPRNGYLKPKQEQELKKILANPEILAYLVKGSKWKDVFGDIKTDIVYRRVRPDVAPPKGRGKAK